MHLYSAEQVKEFVSKSQLDGACLALAVNAAKADAKGRNPDLEPILVSSSATALAPAQEGPIEARAERISPPGSDMSTCRVAILQGSDSDGNPASIAEVLCTFSLNQPAAEPKVASPAQQPMQAQSETAEARRRQIFDGACRVIAKHGFGNATMREIAKESGLSVPLMYKYIKDKDDILYLITTLCMQGIIEFFDTEEFLTGPAELNIAKAVDKYIDYIGDNRRYINLVYSETRSLSAENRAKVFDMERVFMRRWQAILDQGVEQKAFRPMNTDLMSNYIYFLCTVWALRHWSIGQYAESEIRETLKAMILSGILVRQD